MSVRFRLRTVAWQKARLKLQALKEYYENKVTVYFKGLWLSDTGDRLHRFEMVNLRDKHKGDKIDSILFSTSENTAILSRCYQSIRYSWMEERSQHRKKRFQLSSSLGLYSV